MHNTDTIREKKVEKEGLAVKWAIYSLKYYLLVREFVLQMDHRPLSGCTENIIRMQESWVGL